MTNEELINQRKKEIADLTSQIAKSKINYNLPMGSWVSHKEFEISDRKRMTRKMTIEIIDNTTGRPPSAKLIDRIAKEYGLMEMDIDQFAVTEDGHVVLIDDCGNCSYVDTEGFNLRIDFCEVEDGNNNR